MDKSKDTMAILKLYELRRDEQKIADHLEEVRGLFREPDLFIHLETLCRSLPDFEAKMASRKRLIEIWVQDASV